MRLRIFIRGIPEISTRENTETIVQQHPDLDRADSRTSIWRSGLGSNGHDGILVPAGPDPIDAWRSIGSGEAPGLLFARD